MMRSELLSAAVLICASVVAVKAMELRAGRADAASAPPIVGAVAHGRHASPYSDPKWGREVRIPGGEHHQFFVTAAVNQRPASFLVDTGASFVALRERDANLAGLYPSLSDFSHIVRTANGETKAARVTIAAIEIDGIRIESVVAFVLPDSQLSMNLLGMSFLSRLESVEARGGELVLRG